MHWCPGPPGRPGPSTRPPAAAATPRPRPWRCSCRTPADGCSTLPGCAPSAWGTWSPTSCWRPSPISPSSPSTPRADAPMTGTPPTALSTSWSSRAGRAPRGRPGWPPTGGWPPRCAATIRGTSEPDGAESLPYGGRVALSAGSMSGRYADDLRLAHVLADAVDQLTMSRFKAQDLQVSTKPDLTEVTDADQAAEQLVRSQLARSRSRDQVIGEE